MVVEGALHGASHRHALAIHADVSRWAGVAHAVPVYALVQLAHFFFITDLFSALRREAFSASTSLVFRAFHADAVRRQAGPLIADLPKRGAFDRLAV